MNPDPRKRATPDKAPEHQTRAEYHDYARSVLAAETEGLHVAGNVHQHRP